MAQPDGGVGAVELCEIGKIYVPGTSSATRALHTVSLDILDNEIFTSLGPSGRGKTTLLRLVAGLESAARWAIRLSGERLDGLTPHRRPVNTVFQRYALFPHMTVAENVGFGLEMHGKGTSEAAPANIGLMEREDLCRRVCSTGPYLERSA